MQRNDTRRHTHEIGIRVALSATNGNVLRMVLGEGMRLTLIGVAFGIAAALCLTRLIAKLVYGVSALDPLTFGGVAVLLTAVACSPATFLRAAPCASIP